MNTPCGSPSGSCGELSDRVARSTVKLGRLRYGWRLQPSLATWGILRDLGRNRMDDALVQRWVDGDRIARTSLRNAIRSTAERVLGHPAFLGALGPEGRGRFASEDKRRELTGSIADQVMRQKPASAGQVKALSLMTAGRLAVEALQEGRPAVAGERHVPPAIVMQWTLVPDSINPRMKAAAEAHLKECSGCREDLRTMDRIVRTLDAIDHQTSREQLAHEAAKVQSALDETVDLQAAMRTAMQEAREERRAKLERKARGQGKTPVKVLPGRTEEAQMTTIGLWLPLALVVLIGGGLLWFFGGDEEVDAPVVVEGLPALADRSPPEVARIEDLPGGVQPVVADFGSGSCRTAAGRLRGLVRANPDEARLELLEGAAWVCAGDSRKALAILGPLSTEDGGARAPRQVWWYLAQAHLLAGDASAALVALRNAEREDSRHRGRAGAQRARIEAALED